MDRMIKTEFAGRDIYLNYSMAVMFEVIEKYGDVKKALTLIGQDTREGFIVTRHLGLLMAQDAELVCRSLGYDPQPFLSEAYICEHISPYDFSVFRDAVVRAVSAGYNRETKEEAEDVDVGLQQLNQKKTEDAAGDHR